MRSLLVSICLLGGLTALAQTFAPVVGADAPIAAKVPAYTVQPELGNVVNRDILPKLSEEQRKCLVTNSFVARTTAEEQLFYIYENNAYKKIGSFVTTDSVLHTYHIFYDFTLRRLEKDRLFPAAVELSHLMMHANLVALKTPHPAPIREALARNVDYFAVPFTLLGHKPAISAAQQKQVEVELARIAAHEGREVCLTGALIDYSQFVPRGHYTRSKEFEEYFRALMWYGLVPIDLEKEEKLDKQATLQALIITEQLRQSAKARELWQQLYDPTVFYVGKADDLSYYDYRKLADKIFGAGSLERFNDDTKLAAFRELVKKEARGPGIENFTQEEGLQGKQFRFMGQRFIPDSRMLQELTHPKVKGRLFPMGLDVFAVLGSSRAAQLLDGGYMQTQYPHYLEQRKKLQAEITALSPEDWQQNLYYGWMHCLQPLLGARPEGYPSFMRNTAWQDKSLVTALGSWTELRHDTILYAKQSVAECGEGGDDEPPPVPGYVEPEVQVYERLSALLKLNKQGLIARKLLTHESELLDTFDAFIELTDFLAKASRKELQNVPLTRDELREIERYGAELERISLLLVNMGSDAYSTTWWDLKSTTDRNMALVADVHTSKPDVLEEGVGKAAEIWVVVPIQGKLHLTRGAIFTYYEFQHPMNDRLTDEAWQKMLQEGSAPKMPSWTQTILGGPGIKIQIPPTEKAAPETGC